MKLTAQLKLRPTPAHADAVRRTLEAANAACDAISRTAWDTQTFRQFALHTLVYYGIRADFGVSSQLTVRCIAKVADAYTKIVAKAEGTTRAISLEDLKGIRTRVTVRRSQRATLQSWAFFQLRAFIVYKAALAGVDVHLVDPRNTSHLSQVRVYRQGEPQDPSLVCLHTLRVRWPRRCDRCRDYFRQGTRKRAVLLGVRFACRARAKPPPLGGGGLQTAGQEFEPLHWLHSLQQYNAEGRGYP